MALNNTDFESRIQQKIDGLTKSNTSIEFVVPAIADVSTVNLKSSIANTALLPNIYTDNVPSGTIAYPESLGVPIIARKCDNTWLGLDGRTFQQDATWTLWTWGFNNLGQLGDGTTVEKCSPVSVIGGFTDWCSLSVRNGRSFSAIRKNGTLWSWGSNTNGKLGDGTTVCKSSPVSVIGGFTDWCQVSGSGIGGNRTSAVRTNGTLWAWGANGSGQLGDGTTVNKCSPVSVIGGFTDWKYISNAYAQSVALRTNGTLWAWGSNSVGTLGDGTTVDKSSPVSVIGGFTDWCQVSTGQSNVVAVRTNGTLWAWGQNCCGVLGDGTAAAKSSPVSVIGGFTDWCQVSVGQYHTAAVRTNGTIWTWGWNCSGQLGDGTLSVFSKTCSPVSVIGGFTDWCQVSAGVSHTLAIRTNGTLWSWGNGSNGRLGNGIAICNQCSPVSVIGGFTGWSQITSSDDASLAISNCLL